MYTREPIQYLKQYVIVYVSALVMRRQRSWEDRPIEHKYTRMLIINARAAGENKYIIYFISVN